MTDGSLAIATMPPGLPADADYDALCEALMASARGRWFLQEYAKRNRNTDTLVVLDAIARVEAVVRGEQAHHATQGMRIELLEMARTIAQTRADVAEAKPAPAVEVASDPGATDIFAAAGRLQEVAWTMRERGLDMAMCDQIADLSSAILSASSLRNPNDGRAQKLGEVLRSLEQRINVMLSAASEPPASDGSDDRPAAESAAALPAAVLPFAEPEPSLADTAEPELASEPGELDLDPIPVEQRAAPAEAAAPEPPPAPEPSPAPPPAAAESDDFLLAPLPPPGASAAPAASQSATDPLAALRALTPHERIALFT
jgi:hypothetical protein